jgi:Na+-transporting methylmalonyl-CoA/oxaloacetate decarboxylase gamma subunit
MESLKVLGTGMLVVFGVMILLSAGIWLMGRVFIAADRRAAARLAASDGKGGDR